MSAEPAARRGAVVAVVVVAALALVAAVAVVATRTSRDLIGTNGADEAEFVVVIRDRSYCQRGEVVPAGTAAVRLLVGTYGRRGPGLSLVFRSPKRGQTPIATGRLASGWSQGHVIVPLDGVRETARATACVRLARPQRIAIAGQKTFDRRRQVVRIEYLDADENSDLSRLSAIADRYGRGKSRWEGSWTLVLTGVLVASSLFLAARRMVAEGRP